MSRARSIAAVLALPLALLATLLPAPSAAAAATTPAIAAEAIRADLAQAQLAVGGDPTATLAAVARAEANYAAALGPTFATAAPTDDGRAREGLATLRAAAGRGDAPAFAAARGQLWTAILGGSYETILAALRAGDGATAQGWLTLREYRQATRASRPSASATVAVADLLAGQGTADAALATAQADLLDGYQSRLDLALRDLALADQQGFAARRAELAALAEGYFAILGGPFAALRAAAAGQPLGDRLRRPRRRCAVSARPR